MSSNDAGLKLVNKRIQSYVLSKRVARFSNAVDQLLLDPLESSCVCCQVGWLDNYYKPLFLVPFWRRSCKSGVIFREQYWKVKFYSTTMEVGIVCSVNQLSRSDGSVASRRDVPRLAAAARQQCLCIGAL